MSKKEEKIVEINENVNDIEVPEVPEIPGDDKKEEKDMKENEAKKTEKKEVFILFRPFVAIGNGCKKAYGWAKKNPGKAITITNAVTAAVVYGTTTAINRKKRYTTPMPVETNFVDNPTNPVPSIEDIQVPEIPPIPEIPEIPTDIPVTE